MADVTSNKNDTPWASPSGEEEEAGDQPLPGGVSVRNAHAQRARLFPLGEDLYKLDLHRDYSRDWPSLQFQDNTIVLKRGFLEPLEDPDAPYFFLYRGIERFTYSLPERAAQLLATALCLAAYGAAFAATYSAEPHLALASLFSWVTGMLSVVHAAGLVLLAAVDKLWVFWALVAGQQVDKVLERRAPQLRKSAWFWFKAWLAFCLLSTAITPPMPWLMPSPTSFDYPFKIAHMMR